MKADKEKEKSTILELGFMFIYNGGGKNSPKLLNHSSGYGICHHVAWAYCSVKLKLRLKGRRFSIVEEIQETLDTRV